MNILEISQLFGYTTYFDANISFYRKFDAAFKYSILFKPMVH